MIVKLLVVTSEPVRADQLRDAVQAELDPASTEVLVLAPALADGPIKFWLSDIDDAIERATQVRRETVSELSQEGVSAVGRTGAADPMQAITEALATFRADRIVVFAHADRDAQRYREDVDPAEISERFGLPVDRARV